jgi:hypothetical protein
MPSRSTGATSVSHALFNLYALYAHQVRTTHGGSPAARRRHRSCLRGADYHYGMLTSTLPSDWIVQFDANSDADAKVDTVELRSANYTVSVHEATTGNELGTTELSGTDDSCPMFMTFDNDTQSKVYDAPPSKDDLVAFIKPFVQP